MEDNEIINKIILKSKEKIAVSEFIKEDMEMKKVHKLPKIVATIIATVGIMSGLVYATANIYEKIWKEPKKIDSFYGDNYEYDENALYGVGHSKDIDINKNNAITKEEAKVKFEEILKKFGYENEKIISIELVDNPSDDSLFYRATTENKFLLDIDAKDTKNFKIFTDIAYKDIDKCRGTQEEVEKVVQEICKKYGYDLSKYSHKEVSFNISQSAFESKLEKHISIENSPEDANIWQITYNTEYNGVVNKYEEISVGIVPGINKLEHFTYTDKTPENTDIVIDKEKAKEIAVEKENKINIGHNVKNIDIELDIVKMNGYAYLRENNYEHYYESRTTPNYPIENLQYYRVEERVRQVWRVKLEFEQKNDFKYEKEDSFTYYIDTATGEIVGGM